MEIRKLHKAITEYFNKSELETLCFLYFQTGLDNFSGESFSDKVRELIAWSMRKKQMQHLVSICQQERPNINWFELVDIQPKPNEKTDEINVNDALPNDIDQVLESAKMFALEGGRIAREYFRGKENKVFSAETVKNLTTEADSKADKKIVDAIKDKYPGHHIISEEGSAIPKKSIQQHPAIQTIQKEEGYTWVIDAIDGTINFYHQMPIFCTAIGVLWNREPVAGVIYNPISREMFSARKAGGAYWEKEIEAASLAKESLHTSKEKRLSQSVVMTHLSSRRHARERLTTSGLLDALSNASRSIRAVGSGQLSLGHIAKGNFHAFVNNSTNSWDQVAGLVIVQEAGGVVTDFRGEPWTIDTESIIASANKEIHSQLTAIISAVYPFEGPIYRLRDLLHKNPGLETKLIDFLGTLK